MALKIIPTRLENELTGENMQQFFHPSSIAVFGVADNPRNLARNIISNCLAMGFKGKIYPVGKRPGTVHGLIIITDPKALPKDIDLAVLLIPARSIPETMQVCARKGIRHVIISSGGFRELTGCTSNEELEILEVARRYGIRIIGPNCIGVMCTDSGLCTPFNPIQVKKLKKGPVSIIVQSGGVTTQCAYYFSDEYVGFSKIISAGNKLDLNEIDFLEYLIKDQETSQIHMYLESIEDGRKLMALAKTSEKPLVVFKSNVSSTARGVAYSHTAALSNDDRVVDGALRQAGILRVENLRDMVIAAKGLSLPPLRGNRLAVLSMSGGFAVILGDACEKMGFTCPDLPKQIIKKIGTYSRAGVIKMANPMDLGDIHDPKGLIVAIESCMDLEFIDGVVLSFIYDPEVEKIFGRKIGPPDRILQFLKDLSQAKNKPIAFSPFAQREEIEGFKRRGTFPVFNDPVECVMGLRFLRDYWRSKTRSDSP